MKDFARYVILSPVMPISAATRPIPSDQNGAPFCDAVNLDHKDPLGLDGKPLASRSSAQDKRNPAF